LLDIKHVGARGCPRVPEGSPGGGGTGRGGEELP